MTLLVDYSAARPTPAIIKAVGYSGVMRYLSNDPGKNLQPAERDALLAAGLSIGLVWETYANRAAAGFAAGVADAKAAEAQAAALGYPAGLPIFYAVDFDADPAMIKPYFDGISSVATRPVSTYGSQKVVNAALSGAWAVYGWQSCAWSPTDLTASLTHLYQRLKPTVANPISGTDENIILRPFPLWTAATPSSSPASDIPPVFTKPPAPRPIPVSHNTGLSTERPWGAFPLPATDWYGVNDGTPHSHSGLQASDQRGVKQIQREVGAYPDGAFGAHTQAAVTGWQRAHGLLADGKAGVHTWNAMTGA